MSVCWYCYWGWPKPVAEIYQKYLALFGGDEMMLDYGPGHIVWADENFEDHHIQWCLDHSKSRDGMTPEQDRLAREALRELLEVPESIRCCEPEDYDECNPESFPPPVGLEMIQI